jgi:methyl-accepting chemotaxis protein
MKFKYGIKNKILVPVLSVTILSYLVTLGYISFEMYTRAVFDSKTLIDNQTKIQSEQISNYILPKIAISENFTHTIEIYNNLSEKERKQSIVEVLKSVQKHNPNFLSVSMSRVKNFYDPKWTKEYGRNRITVVADSVGKQKIIDEELNLNGEPPNILYATLRKANIEKLVDPYRQDVLRNGKPILMTSIVVPVQENGKFIGLAGIDISLAQLDGVIKAGVSVEGSKAFLVSASGDFIASSDILYSYDKSKNIKNLTDSAQNVNRKISEAKAFSYIQQDSMGSENYFSFHPVNFSGDIPAWSYGITVPLRKVLAEARKTLVIAIISGIIGLILMTVLISFIARTFIKPILESSEFSRKLAEGDFTAKIRVRGKDEIGEMLKNLNHMRENLSEVFRKVKNTAYILDTKSKDLKANSTIVHTGASQQAASSEEVLASIEEMAAAFEQNAENTELSSRSAEKTILRLKKTEKSVDETAEIMKQISQKLSVIDEIAFKTKLLSINSSIEAARAGSMGKGFAVLSSEVRKLADKVKEISEDIKKISNQAVTISDKSVVLLQELIPEIQNSAKMIQVVSQSTHEQKSGAQQVTEAVAQMSLINQKNVNMSEQIDISSEDLAVLANEMLMLVKFFRI